jgi:enamine deaminase RidA (YjgF/YER057c/UK114 family)
VSDADEPAHGSLRSGSTLPPVPAPAAAYVPAVRHGDLVIVSGQLPSRTVRCSRPGSSVTADGEHDVEAAAALARRCALNVLAAAASVAGGLDAIASVLRVGVFVASGEGFTSQHLVANGASELLAAVLGPGAVHARAAVGVAAAAARRTGRGRGDAHGQGVSDGHARAP